MFRNYLKIALRNLRKHRFYSFINITGLAVGISCVLFILLYVQNELSYDQHFSAADRIYRVDFDGKIGEQLLDNPNSPDAMGPL
ncbi:MAG: ABC transporter permease, partial [Bacteroidota bacterium]